MRSKSSSHAARVARAKELKKQIQSLGGYCGGRPDFEEATPDLAIEFYEGVLAEERRINGEQSSSGVN